MRTICCVFLFFFLCAGGYARKNTPAGQIFRTKPCLQSLTGNGITVSWLTHVPVYSWVEYTGVEESPDDARRTSSL